MANILHIETSTQVCSVALTTDGVILFERENHEGSKHASLLGVYTFEAMNWLKDEGLHLDAVAVGMGPGSYTGLRIGVSMAKGLCYGLGVPLIAISPLEIMTDFVIASGVDTDFYCPMLDARRMEVYTAVFDRELCPVKPVSAEIIDETYLNDYLSKAKVLFFGNGSGKSQPLIQSPNAIFLDGIYPSASRMIRLAGKAFENKRWEDVAYFEPFYLKEFMATTPRDKIGIKN